MSKSLGKSAWFGKYRLPTDKRDHVAMKRARRAREKREVERDVRREDGS